MRHFLKLVDILTFKLSITRLYYDSTKRKIQVTVEGLLHTSERQRFAENRLAKSNFDHKLCDFYLFDSGGTF